MNPEHRRREQLQILGAVFRPAGPIDHQDLFRGRLEQLAKVNSAIHELGRHGLIFGERGVGKTSLAAVSADLCGRSVLSMRINCDITDVYSTLWEKVIDELSTIAATAPDQPVTTLITRAIEILHFGDLNPGRVRQALEVLSGDRPVLVFFDEFDRLQESSTLALMADTIKTLSDQLTKATLFFVGVADDAESLIAEHASISRALAQIRMPRMAANEIHQIVEAGFSQLEIAAEKKVMDLLVHLPQGLPAYAHALAQQAALSAILRAGSTVGSADLKYSISDAISSADESMTRLYTDATTSSHKTLYERVLLACALAPVDDMGYFTPGELRGPLRTITGEDLDIPRFSRHLVQFCNERGPVLERRGGERRWRYRFIDPMMRPYLTMRAYERGMDLEALAIVPEAQDEHLF